MKICHAVFFYTTGNVSKLEIEKAHVERRVNMEDIKIEIQHTKDLAPQELVNIMIERVKVFVVEQNCPYQEIDEADYEAEHVILKQDNPRLLYDDTVNRIGRVLVNETYRKNKLGYKLMETAIAHLQEKEPHKPIQISAQAHLVQFYGSFGFKQISDIYLEDDIPHVDMLLDAKQ